MRISKRRLQMATNTKIEWAHHTFNPWIGCAKVSDGCKNCYAEILMDQRYGLAKWGVNGTRTKTSEANWKKPLQWNAQAEKEGTRYRVFCASLADVFEDKEELDAWRVELFQLIIDTPNLDWLLLTKRPENIKLHIERIRNAVYPFNVDPNPLYIQMVKWISGDAPKNIWLGTSVENQEQADIRIPHLVKMHATLRFVSCEPLLGMLNLQEVDKSYGMWLDALDSHPLSSPDRPFINWVIAGCESGPKARPVHPDWIRSLRDQCAAANVPFLFKQWGEFAPGSNLRELKYNKEFIVLNNGDYGDYWKPMELNNKYATRWNEMHATAMTKVGKKASGNLLDGVQHLAFPQLQEVQHA
jgi:protein gp37